MTTREFSHNLAEMHYSSDCVRHRDHQGLQLGLVEQSSSAPTSGREPVIEIFNEWLSSENLNQATLPSSSSSECSPVPSPSSVASDDSRSLPDNSANTNDHKLVNGWIPLMESIKLGPGQVRKAKLFGKDLIVTRSQDGRQVNVLDAYCPHAGVHIGVGGKIKRINNETCVECPFHGWAFRTQDGQCVDIPYQRSNPKRRVPKQAKLASWICVEVDNFIYIWHHMDGLGPTWHLEPSNEIGSGKVQLVCRSYHKSYLDLCYMHENGADMHHFSGIHQDFFGFGEQIPGLQAFQHMQKYIRHIWKPEWKPLADESGKQTHKAQLKVIQHLQLFGKLTLFPSSVVATQIGPAVVKLRYKTGLGEGLVVMNCVPMGGRRVKYIQHLYTDDKICNRLMGKLFMWGECVMLERDLMIWNHKKSIKNYILVPEDRHMRMFKLWYSQFYKRRRKITIRDVLPDAQSKYTPNGIGSGKSVNF